ncbi:MAG TPA: hypothetical protein VLT62_08915 [Candidatus Methylomirabilis sp.]|nr:hypothetical protein [Candidatus Methylomirabilis sp.]
MLDYDPRLSAQQLTALRSAVAAISGKLEEDEDRASGHDPAERPILPRNLRRMLRGMVDAESVYPRLTIAYDPQTAAYGYTGGSCIWIGEKSFQQNSPSDPRLAAVLLHEMVHAACGLELDAEAFENALFEGAGATPPDDDGKDDDWDKFRRRNWEGRWVYLVRDRSNGNLAMVNTLWGSPICRFPIPADVTDVP